jgi:zinc protease
MRRAFSLALGLLVMVFIAARAALALNADVSTFALSNGMQVVVIPDHRAPVVTHMVWYKAGAADEPDGEAGVAHFLEHLLFKGTPRHPSGEFSQIVRRNGGEENAFTAQDYTGYFQRIAKDRLPLVMELEADRMQNLILNDQTVLPERNVILEERRERTENEPSALLGEQMDAAMYTVHPYSKPVIGWRNQMETLTREDAISFYRQHYTPANAVLIVAGDVTRDEVRALAEKFYGPLQNTVDITPRKRPEEPAPIAARRVLMSDPRAADPVVQRTYLAPSYATAQPRQAEALDVLAEALGGGATSRLYRTLVVNQKIASYAAAWYSGDGLDSGKFSVYGTPNPGGDIAKVEAALDAVLADVLNNGLTQEEIKRAKNSLLADAVYALDSQAALARAFGTALTTGLSAQDVIDWPQRVESVTADDIKIAAALVLNLRASVTGVLVPQPGGPGGEPPQPAQAPTTVN